MSDLTLVTGASGFVGQVLVRRLLKAGRAVRVLVLPDAALPPDWENRVDIVRGDISRAEDVRRAMTGVTTVQHLAAAVGDWIPWPIHQAVTVNGTRHVVEAASEQACRLVLTSSVTVYGHHIRRRVCDEALGHGRPQGNYSRAKQAQEREVEAAVKAGALDAVTVRPGNIYGPACGPWLIELGRALRRGVPSLLADQTANAGLVHVDSVAELLIAAQLRAETGSVFNACDELDVSWQRYFADIGRLVQAPPPRRLPYRAAAMLAPVLETVWLLFRRPGRPPLTREAFNLVAHDNRFPSQRARSALGWQPALDYPAAMAEIGRYLAVHPIQEPA